MKTNTYNLNSVRSIRRAIKNSAAASTDINAANNLSIAFHRLRVNTDNCIAIIYSFPALAHIIRPVNTINTANPPVEEDGRIGPIYLIFTESEEQSLINVRNFAKCRSTVARTIDAISDCTYPDRASYARGRLDHVASLHRDL
jgi:hypothetical protein